MDAKDGGFACDLTLWEPVRLVSAVGGLEAGTIGVVCGWDGRSGVYRFAPSRITAKEAPVEVAPSLLEPREQAPPEGTALLEALEVVQGDSDFGSCELCAAGEARKLGLVSPLFTCCGRSVCAACARGLGQSGLVARCPCCGDADVGRQSLEQSATVARRLARKGDPRAFYGLAALDEVLSVEETSQYLIALVTRGYGEAMLAYANACAHTGFVGDGPRPRGH